MTFEEALKKKKSTILKKWSALITQTYPEGGAGLPKNKDRFTNPVGYIISSTITVLYEALLKGDLSSSKVSTSLDDFIKVRAVQDFSPSQAVSFVYLLKKALSEELRDEVREDSDFEAMLRLYSNIDDLALHAFDIYMDCREKVCQVKVNEMKAALDNTFRWLERQSRKDSMCAQIPGLEREVSNGYNRTEVE